MGEPKTRRITIEAVGEKERETFKEFSMEVKRRDLRVKTLIYNWIQRFLRGDLE